jgi:hypothetical protein
VIVLPSSLNVPVKRCEKSGAGASRQYRHSAWSRLAAYTLYTPRWSK